MAVNAFTSNQGTQTNILTDNTGGTAGTVIPVMKVSMDAQGTYTDANLFQGTILQVNNIGTLPNIPQGSINITAGTIATLGTMGTLGLINTVTTVSNITNGSIRMTVGTIAAGSIAVTAGTIATLGTMGTLGLVNTVTTVSNLTAGSIAVTAGTVSAGTINIGTFQQNPKPTVVVNAFGTTTTGTIGTLVAAPSAGSAIFITSLDVSVQSGTVEPCISFGLAATGNGVVSRGLYVPGGGIAKTYNPANSGSNTGTALTYNVLTSSGTVSYNVAYFIAVP